MSVGGREAAILVSDNNARRGNGVIQAAFFDIDGTLLSNKTGHVIPQGTKDALVALRRRGVKCCICSGRPKAQLPWCIRDGFPGFEGGFDAYVVLTGSMCYDERGIYADTPIDRGAAERFVGLVDEGLFDCLTLDAENAYANRDSEKVHELERMVAYSYPIRGAREMLENPIYQFCAFLGPKDQHIVEDVMTDCIVTRWCDLFCDIVPKSSSKPKGVQATLDHFGISDAETIAFGDGGNDATMLAYCTLGVAMGNGTDEAKAAADYVTSNIEDDGIAKALRHFGLID